MRHETQHFHVVRVQLVGLDQPSLRELKQGRDLTRQYFAGLFASLAPATRLHAGPDPELTVHLMHIVGDELVKLRLRDPAGYPVERLLAQFRWIVGEALGRREVT